MEPLVSTSSFVASACGERHSELRLSAGSRTTQFVERGTRIVVRAGVVGIGGAVPSEPGVGLAPSGQRLSEGESLRCERQGWLAIHAEHPCEIALVPPAPGPLRRALHRLMQWRPLDRFRPVAR